MFGELGERVSGGGAFCATEERHGDVWYKVRIGKRGGTTESQKYLVDVRKKRGVPTPDNYVLSDVGSIAQPRFPGGHVDGKAEISRNS